MTSSPTEPLTSPSPSSPAPTVGVTAPPLRVTGPSPASWTPSPTTSQTGAGAGGDGGPADPVTDASPTATPSSGEISGLSLKDLARGLVLAVTARIAAAVSRGDDEAAELLVATTAEQQAIGDPIAKIGGRHVKTSVGNPDIADLVVAGVAAAGYVFRAVTGMWNLKRHRAAITKATGDPAESAKPVAGEQL